jgi:hypothetical protein
MITLRVTVDSAVIQAVRKLAKQMPTRMEREFKTISDTVQAGIIKDLRALEPGRPRYPIQWTSEKQRRSVMRKLRKAGNIPYRRTGALMKAWRARRYTTKSGGFITVTNDVPIAPYVIGDDAYSDWQQFFHIQTGWPTARQVADVKTLWAGRGEIMIIKKWAALAAEVDK